MKIIKVAALLLASMSFAHAGETIKTEVFCDTTAKIIRSLANEHGEAPLITLAGTAQEKFVIMVNKTNESWTFVQLEITPGNSCVYATGQGIRIKTPGNGI